MIIEPSQYDRKKVIIVAAVVAGVVFITIFIFYILQDMKQPSRPNINLDRIPDASSEDREKSMTNVIKENNKDASRVDESKVVERRSDMEREFEEVNGSADSSNPSSPSFSADNQEKSNNNIEDVKKTEKMNDMLMEINKASIK